jgi:MIP family channel proteins
MTDLKKCAAEALGTFYLCFAGIAAILCVTMNGWGDDSGGLLIIAMAHGLALSIGVSVTGGISGGHLNPAVTISMLVTGRIQLQLALKYIFFQILGAMFAAYLCKVLFTGTEVVAAANLGIPLPGEAFANPTTIILGEFILTFLLVTSVFGTAIDERGRAVKFGALAIGLTVAFDILAGGAITGASMNPARSLGPALIQGDFQFHWCYWVGPVLGAIAAGLFYDRVLLDKK